jgi:DNA-binding NtrC family response regulator
MRKRAGTGGRPSSPPTAPRGGNGPAHRFLLASANGGIRVHELPGSGDIVIGRSRDCQIALDSPSISRRHTRLRLGPTCSIADLGSRNGTLFRGERLPPGEEREIADGDCFAVGPFSLFLVPVGAVLPEATAGGARLVVDDPTGAASPSLLLAVAQAPVSVLVHGEAGVGKHVLATTLHRLSGRRGPLVAVNCALLGEAELFGHDLDVTSRAGVLRAAAGGTVVLDDIGDLAPAIQSRLLRALETHEVLPLGGARPVPIDVRLLATTRRDLLALVHSGGFRRDLYYRLAGFALEIPPLRERRGQIGALAAQILAEAAARTGAAPAALGAAAVAALADHRWPGNVRELRGVLERALGAAGDREIGPADLRIDAPSDDGEDTIAPSGGDERARLLAALEASAGNQTRAARMLGMSRTAFAQKLALHQIGRPRR